MYFFSSEDVSDCDVFRPSFEDIITLVGYWHPGLKWLLINPINIVPLQFTNTACRGSNRPVTRRTLKQTDRQKSGVIWVQEEIHAATEGFHNFQHGRSIIKCQAFELMMNDIFTRSQCPRKVPGYHHRRPPETGNGRRMLKLSSAMHMQEFPVNPRSPLTVYMTPSCQEEDKECGVYIARRGFFPHNTYSLSLPPPAFCACCALEQRRSWLQGL